MKFIELSYNINENTPSYGGRHKVSIKEYEQIKNGNTANSYMINFYIPLISYPIHGSNKF